MTDEERVDAIINQISNESRSQRRRHLYRTDPIWRLTKLKQCREDRMRAKLRAEW